MVDPVRREHLIRVSRCGTWDSTGPKGSSGRLTLVESGLAAPAQAAAGAPGPRAGQRTRRVSWLWGPAFVAAVAYVDPGNVAANLTAGAYVSFTNATAFSPTDTMPMPRWAKALMAVQSAIALSTTALVIARAVNILK